MALTGYVPLACTKSFFESNIYSRLELVQKRLAVEPSSDGNGTNVYESFLTGAVLGPASPIWSAIEENDVRNLWRDVVNRGMLPCGTVSMMIRGRADANAKFIA